MDFLFAREKHEFEACPLSGTFSTFQKKTIEVILNKNRRSFKQIYDGILVCIGNSLEVEIMTRSQCFGGFVGEGGGNKIHFRIEANK